MTQDVVYRRVRRPDADLVRRASGCAVSDLYEALPGTARDAALMSPRMRPLVPGLRIAGPAVTARCAPGDNLMMHKALLLAEPGDVLVIVGGGQSAQWGHLAALYAARKGVAGVVVDGSIRDTDLLLARRYPVWSTAISPAHPEKRGHGAVNVPVVCDGCTVRPGDIVAADTDGVLAIARDDLADAVAAAEAAALAEHAAAAAIAGGSTLYDIHALDDAFSRTGVAEHDGAWDD